MKTDERTHLELEERFQRDLGAIQVPTEDRWVPQRPSAPSGLLGQVAIAVPLGTLLVIFALIFGGQLRERQAPATSTTLPLPPAKTVAATPVTDPARAGLAVKAPPAAAAWDLVYAVSRKSAPGDWTTEVFRLDPMVRNPRLLAVVPPSSRPPAVFASPKGAIYAFGPERSPVFRPARFQGPTLPLLSSGSEGPPLEAISMHFIGEGAFVSTATETFELSDSPDLALFPTLRKLAPVGGQILGELEDGRLLIASNDEPTRQVAIRAVALDGRVWDLLAVPGGVGPSAASTGSIVITVRDDPSSPDRGMVAVVGWDLRTSREISTQAVGNPNNVTLAVTHRAPGYLFTDPKAFFATGGEHAGLVPLGARGAGGPNWDSSDLTRYRLPMLDARLSWSPDDAYVGFATAAEHMGGIPNEMAPRSPSAQGIALYTSDKRRVFEVAPEVGATVRVAGWAAR